MELIAENLAADQCGFTLVSEGTQTSSSVEYVRGGRFVYISESNQKYTASEWYRTGDETSVGTDTAGVARCITGGDWNAQTGTSRRAVES